MKQSLLFIPDISGFTQFVQTTEAEHSQHVISELLEVLINANTQDLKLAEIEGDALFFYKEASIPSQEKLLAQIETMFTAFYSHLKMLEKNRICPCNACATAPQLQLKIVAHSGELQFLDVQGNHKPFGQSVIEAHRLLKNSVNSDNYTLISSELAGIVGLPLNYRSKLFQFEAGADTYDGKEISYGYAEIDTDNLTLRPYDEPVKADLKHCKPNVVKELDFDISAEELLEYITNYRYRYEWAEGVDDLIFDENEVTRLGSEHVCVINGKQLDFVTVTKDVEPGQLVYGELTTSPPPVDALYTFFIVTPTGSDSCRLRVEVFWKALSPIKKLIITLFAKRALKEGTFKAIENLKRFSEKKTS